MNGVTVIHGTFADNRFVPDETPPLVQGRAELIVFAGSERNESTAKSPPRTSIFDLLGRAAVLRSGEDIDAQIERERQGWGDD